MSKVRAIIPDLGPDAKTWERVIQLERDNARPSVDGTQRLVSWLPGEQPSWLPPGTVVYETPEELAEFAAILDGPDWNPPEEPE